MGRDNEDHAQIYVININAFLNKKGIFYYNFKRFIWKKSINYDIIIRMKINLRFIPVYKSN